MNRKQRTLAMELVQVALDAVDPFAAVCGALRLDASGQQLDIGGVVSVDLAAVDRVVVVGGGKAVLYTSDLTAYSNMYVVEVGEFEELPDLS